jgi:hypothetical protein
MIKFFSGGSAIASLVIAIFAYDLGDPKQLSFLLLAIINQISFYNSND